MRPNHQSFKRSKLPIIDAEIVQNNPLLYAMKPNRRRSFQGKLPIVDAEIIPETPYRHFQNDVEPIMSKNTIGSFFKDRKRATTNIKNGQDDPFSFVTDIFKKVEKGAMSAVTAAALGLAMLLNGALPADAAMSGGRMGGNVDEPRASVTRPATAPSRSSSSTRSHYNNDNYQRGYSQGYRSGFGSGFGSSYGGTRGSSSYYSVRPRITTISPFFSSGGLSSFGDPLLNSPLLWYLWIFETILLFFSLSVVVLLFALLLATIDRSTTVLLRFLLERRKASKFISKF